MNCPQCNTGNHPGASSCKRCEAELPPNCCGCGAPVDEGKELCPSCRTERLPAALGAELADIPEIDADPDDEAAPDPEFLLAPRFVGRAGLLGALSARIVESLGRAEPVFLALTGAAGMGKSRLARELGNAVQRALPEARVLGGKCGGPAAPPFLAFSRILAARFGIEEGEPGRTARDKIAQAVAELLPGQRGVEVAHLLGQLVDYPFPESPIVEPLAEAPSHLEARMFIAARRFFAVDAERAPIVVVLDDVDRAPPETVNLLHFLAAGLDGRPLVLCAVGRESLYETYPAFASADQVFERVQVGPLEPEDAEALFAELCRPAGDAPPEVLRHAREKMDGSPRALFEMARYLLETGVIERGGAEWRWNRGQLLSTPLPGRIEELLAARLAVMDASERDLLEKAAACGERFWLDAVVALIRGAALCGGEGGDPDGPSLGEIAGAGDRNRAEVAVALSRLARRGLLVEQQHSAIPGEREYRFASPPWRDVIHESIEEQARRRYHRLVAQWLELRPQGRGEEEQEEIGRHLERAGDGDGAALRYRRAAEVARGRYYNDKAVRLFSQALRCLGPGDLASRIQLWHDLGSVHQLRGEHDEALAAFERMLRLSWVVASRSKAAVAYNKMGRIYRQKGDLPVALEHLDRGLDFFKQASDERGIAGSLDDIGQVLWLLGRYDDALDRSAAGLERRRKIGDKRSIAVSLLNIGHIERHRGLFDEAESCYCEALKLRQDLGDRVGVATCRNGLGVLAFQRGDLDGARQQWEEALHVAEEIGAAPLVAAVEVHLGELARALGSLGEARTRLERAATIANDLDDRRLRSEAVRNLGLLELAGGGTAKAIDLCEQALAIAEGAGIPVDVGRALVALGEANAVTLFDDTGGINRKAEDYFLRGVATFREIGNHAELAVALERFGTFRVECGDVAGGRELLTEAQDLFARLGMNASEDVRRMLGELG